ncbi:MAG: hypothetical protein FK733_18230 [Asgard group archaeon]|nr:hypothetical protein [Asgard group archaeon]
MIENAIIFSKEIKDIVLSSTYGGLDPNSERYAIIVEKIKEVALKDQKGTFNLDLDGGLIALIFNTNRFSVIFIFNKTLDDNSTKEWEKTAKDITNGFNRVYDPWNVDDEKHLDYKDTLDEIINWQLNQESPIDKMKDALW